MTSADVENILWRLFLRHRDNRENAKICGDVVWVLPEPGEDEEPQDRDLFEMAGTFGREEFAARLRMHRDPVVKHDIRFAWLIQGEEALVEWLCFQRLRQPDDYKRLTADRNSVKFGDQHRYLLAWHAALAAPVGGAAGLPSVRHLMDWLIAEAGEDAVNLVCDVEHDEDHEIVGSFHVLNVEFAFDIYRQSGSFVANSVMNSAVWADPATVVALNFLAQIGLKRREVQIINRIDDKMLGLRGLGDPSAVPRFDRLESCLWQWLHEQQGEHLDALVRNLEWRSTIFPVVFAYAIDIERKYAHGTYLPWSPSVQEIINYS